MQAKALANSYRELFPFAGFYPLPEAPPYHPAYPPRFEKTACLLLFLAEAEARGPMAADWFRTPEVRGTSLGSQHLTPSLAPSIILNPLSQPQLTPVRSRDQERNAVWGVAFLTFSSPLAS